MTLLSQQDAISKPLVFHVGTLESANRKQRLSFEGDSLSVSEVPDAWRAIAKLGNAPEWELSRASALFLDMHNPRVVATLAEMCLASGLLEQCVVYEVHYEDEDGKRYQSFPSKEAVEAEFDVDEFTEVKLVDGLRATRKLERLNSTIPAFCVGDLAVALATVELAKSTACPEALQGFDGLWWDEELAPEHYSAPRGCIFASKVPGWCIQAT